MNEMAALSRSASTALNVLANERIAAYLPQGIPGIFTLRRPAVDHAQADAGEPVLFLPSRVLAVVCESSCQGQALRTGLGDHPLLVEGHHLYPLLWRGELLALLSPDDGAASISHGAIKGLLAELATERLAAGAAVDRAWEQFVVRNLRTDHCVEQFLKAVLDYFVDTWEGCYAGVYAESVGTFTRRLAVGSVARFHTLLYEWSASEAARVLSSIEAQVRFIPVEPVLLAPQFLSEIPDMMLVHPGLKADPDRHILAVAGPGDLDAVRVGALQKIAGTVALLERNSFCAVGDLGPLYHELAGSARPHVHRLLCDVSTMFDRAGITAWLGVAREQADPGQQNWEVVRRQADRRWVETVAEPALPQEILESLRRGSVVHIPDVSSGQLPIEFAKRRYVHGIHSEIYVPLMGPQGYEGLLNIGSPTTGDALLRLEPRLRAIADLLSLAQRCAADAPATDTVEGVVTQLLPARLTNRLTLLQRLSDGLLHELSQSLLVLFGKVELVHATSTQTPGSDHDRIEGLFEAIGKQTDAVAGQLRILRRIVAGAEQRRHELLDGARLVRDLPDLLAGYQLRLKDSKNIHVPLIVTRWQHANFVVDAVAVYDLLLPALLAVMERAVCSGQLSVGAEPGERSARLVVRFPRQLLGYTSLGLIMAMAFRGYVADNGGEHAGVIRCEFGRLQYHLFDEDHYELALQCDAAGLSPATAKRAIP